MEYPDHKARESDFDRKAWRYFLSVKNSAAHATGLRMLLKNQSGRFAAAMLVAAAANPAGSSCQRTHLMAGASLRGAFASDAATALEFAFFSGRKRTADRSAAHIHVLHTANYLYRHLMQCQVHSKGMESALWRKPE